MLLGVPSGKHRAQGALLQSVDIAAVAALRLQLAEVLGGAFGIHAGLDAEGAAEYLSKLQAEGRYSRDVY